MLDPALQGQRRVRVRVTLRVRVSDRFNHIVTFQVSCVVMPH